MRWRVRSAIIRLNAKNDRRLTTKMRKRKQQAFGNERLALFGVQSGLCVDRMLVRKNVVIQRREIAAIFGAKDVIEKSSSWLDAKTRDYLRSDETISPPWRITGQIHHKHIWQHGRRKFGGIDFPSSGHRSSP